MQPFFAVHNNVSLLSVTIAPSTFLAALTLVFVFLSLYLPRPSLPRFLSFGRRRTENTGDRDVYLQAHQKHFVRDIGDGYGNFPDARQWRNREDPTVDWRHRRLPPLPPPPFRPLLQERGYIEARYQEEEEALVSSRKKSSSRSDRERLYRKEAREGKEDKERERERKRERKREDDRLDWKGSRPSTPSKEKHRTRSYTNSPTSKGTPTDLVSYSSGFNREGAYSTLDPLSDDSRYQGACETGSSDASGWLPAGVLGRFASVFRSGEQPATDAVYLPPPRAPVSPATRSAEREQALHALTAEARPPVDPFQLPRDRQRGDRKHGRFGFREWVQSARMAPTGKRRP